MIYRQYTIRNAAVNAFYGLIIGSSMLIPGMSGGTTAIILGIYDKLIGAVSRFFSDIRGSLLLLGSTAAGGIAGVVLFSGMILHLTEQFPVYSMYFFIGAIAGGIPLLISNAGLTRKRLYCLIFVLSGAGAALGLSLLPAGSGQSENLLIQIISGILIAGAMVLPGISTSHMLLSIGMYESVWGAIRRCDFLYLLPVMTGGIIGTVLFAKLTDYCLKKYPCQTYMAMLGFVLASCTELFPADSSVSEIPTYVCLFILGFTAVFLFTLLEDGRAKQKDKYQSKTLSGGESFGIKGQEG